MTELALDDRARIEALLTEYGWRIDHGGNVGELFVTDGVVCAPTLGIELQGGAAITKRFSVMHADVSRATKHVWTNLRIAEIVGCTVKLNTTQTTYLHLCSEPPAVKHLMVGETYDIVRREGDGPWLFVERRLNVLLPFDVTSGS